MLEYAGFGLAKMLNRLLRRVVLGCHHGCHLLGGMFIALASLGLGDAHGQEATYTLGSTSFLIGPAAGTNSVVLGVSLTNGAWTASANDSWLHLGASGQSGVGSTNVIFAYDYNSGATRTGTITIGGNLVTISQAGSSFVSTQQVKELGVVDEPCGLAIDSAGNVYIASLDIPSTGKGAVYEWRLSDNTIVPLVTSGLRFPSSVAVDAKGNVYIADAGDNAIKELPVAGGG